MLRKGPASHPQPSPPPANRPTAQDAARRIQARVRGWLARVRRAELDRQRGRQERFQRVMARHQERVQVRPSATRPAPPTRG